MPFYHTEIENNTLFIACLKPQTNSKLFFLLYSYFLSCSTNTNTMQSIHNALCRDTTSFVFMSNVKCEIVSPRKFREKATNTYMHSLAIDLTIKISLRQSISYASLLFPQPYLVEQFLIYILTVSLRNASHLAPSRPASMKCQ